MNTCCEKRKDLGILLIRIIIGVVFMFHGSQKLFGMFGGHGMEGFTGFIESLGVPFPKLNAYLAAAAEFFGGLAVLVGFKMRLATIPMIFTMVVAIVTVHNSAFSSQASGMEYPLTLGMVLAGLWCLGAGKFSLDAKCCTKTCES